MYQVVSSKMKKTKVLLHNRTIARHIPQTLFFSQAALKNMINRYPLLFVKPDQGHKGKRVAAIRKSGDNYLIHYETRIIPVRDINAVLSFVHKLSRKDIFILQQGIELLKIDQRPSDLRIMVQKPYDQWEISGIMGRNAAPGMIVTNRSRGGILMSHDKLMQKADVPEEKARYLLEVIYSLSTNVADCLTRSFPGLRELGIDMGIDQEFWPWIFEVNTKPVRAMFKGNQEIQNNHRIIMESLQVNSNK